MNWQSRKFVHALIVQLTAGVALFTGHMDGPTWVAASTLALGIYAAANIAHRKVEEGNA